MDPTLTRCIVQRRCSLPGGSPAAPGDLVDIDLQAHGRLVRNGTVAPYDEPEVATKADLKKLRKPDLVERATAAGVSDAESLTVPQLIEALTAPNANPGGNP